VESVADWFEHALGLPEATEACLSRQLSGREVLDLFLAPQEAERANTSNLGLDLGGARSQNAAKEAVLRSLEEVLRIDDATKRAALWSILDCVSRRVEF